jgi:hypothetical protein
MPGRVVAKLAFMVAAGVVFLGSQGAWASPQPAGPPASSSSADPAAAELKRLDSECTTVVTRYFAVEDVRKRLLHLVTAMECLKRSGSAENVTRVEKAVTAYKDACATNRIAVASVVTAGLSTSCSSLDGQIAKLNAEDKVVARQVAAVQNVRRDIERLITAIQQYRRAATTCNADLVAKARKLYDASKTS